jgi:precorrin-2/cobalt-factor-2 C20-methyltransferase
VYLPEELKAELAALAGRWRRSEADLIRVAVERLVRSAESEAAPGRRPAPEPRPAGPRLIGVGVGPSDPGLVTERALDVLRGADRVFAASTGPDAIGRAETIVRTAAPEVAVDRLPVAVTGTEAERQASLADAAKVMVAALDAGEVVVFVTLGDPNVYSTFPDLHRLVAEERPGVPVETVPGLMAFQELAARAGVVLAEPGEHVVVLTAEEGLAHLTEALENPTATVVVYKGGRYLPEIAGRLSECDRLDGAVVGELLGLPGERTVPVSTVADRPASYLATIVVPARR